MPASLAALSRFMRLAVVALAALTPTVPVESCRDVIVAVDGGPAPEAAPARATVFARTAPGAPPWPQRPVPPRAVPRAQAEARFLVHGALLI